MKITFLMRSMAVGGAQRQLCVLCSELLRRGHEVRVLLFYAGEPLDAELRELGVGIVDLKKGGRWRNLAFLLRLVRAVRAGQPDVLYAQLPVPNLLALLLPYLGVSCAIACGVRASEMTARVNWLARLTLQLERRFVLRADVVIVNSQVGADHLCRGEQHPDVVVIDNGIETSRFSFDREGRRRMRRRWNAGDATAVVGCVARLDPMKDHVNLLRAFARLRQDHPDARLICVGTFSEPYFATLKQCARQLGVEGSVQWQAHEPHLSDLYSAFDALCLSSAYGEGFPNVLAEAMACGVPCVATDVGDAGRILSSADFLVPARDAQSLAGALARALAQGREFSALRVEKIRDQFSPARLADRTELALRAALERRNDRLASNSSK
jgi:glycosyltransferase involved in cell wall biosynthesis